jgi:Uma2 family endonuclease
MIASAFTPLAPSRTPSPLDDLIDRAGIVPLTVEQYRRMIEQRILPEDTNFELLRGVVVRKNRSSPGEDPMGHGPLHRLIVAILIKLAAKIDGPGRHMQIQLPVECPPYGDPEPDASIIHGQPWDYQQSNPSAEHCSCVIEVADSSLHRDQTDKLMTYAGAGIGQYIIINLEAMTAEVYTDPDRATESYRTKATFQRGDTVTLILPDGMFELPVADVLPE